MDTKYLTTDVEPNWLNSFRHRSVPVPLLWFLKALLFFTLVIGIIFLCFDTSFNSAARQQEDVEPIASSVAAATTAAPPPATTPAPLLTTTPFVDRFAIFRKRPPADTPSGQACYQSDHIDFERVHLFDDVLTAEQRPFNGSNIFFHETSCLNGTARLSVRQACAVESAALTNPKAGIYLLYASPAGFERGAPLSPHFAALSEYANVHLRTVNLWTYAMGTPAEAFMRTTKLFHSQYPSVHAADFVRLLSLYRFGGTHIDLDFVVRRSFETQPRTFVGEEIGGFLSNAVLSFDRAGLGHVIAGHVLTEFVKNFDGQVFAANGPALLKRVFHQLCQNDGDLFDCLLIKVEHKEKFYPVYGTVWERLFDKEHAAESMAVIKNAIAVHMWNALSSPGVVTIGDGSAYEQLAREFCPKVFATIKGGKF